MKPKRNAPWSETGDYEHAPKSDWGVAIALIIVVIAFVVITVLTEEPENQAQEAMGEAIYQLKT